MKKIIRVFPQKTNCSPTDEYCFFGPPGFFIPPHDEIHISVCFTWDVGAAKRLKFEWEGATDRPILIGGPAMNSHANGFQSGQYVKKGITITSRGCPHRCNFCLVPKREGGIRELEIKPGHIIQDNNLLACSDRHIEAVFDMLKTQRRIEFTGGLESRRITTAVCEKLRGLKIKALWLACDSHGAINPLRRAIENLKQAGFKQKMIRCYVLIGKNRNEERDRLKTVFELGALPFAQLYQPEEKISYSKEWRDFSRRWSRPAIYKRMARTSYNSALPGEAPQITR